MICSVLGHSTPRSTLLVFVLTWLPRRQGGSCSHHSQTPWRNLGFPLNQHGHFSWNALAGAGALQSPCSLLQARVSLARVQMVTLEPQPLKAPVYMCSHPLSLQGSDWPSKMITSTLFFCILINSEEVGAVKLYVGGNLNTGLFGVVKPLTAFNTQLVILKNYYWDSDLKEYLICYISKICK